jgi:hypothetical protein
MEGRVNKGSLQAQAPSVPTELVERLSAATVGSRELGHELLLSLGWHRTCVGHFYGPLYQWSAPDRTPHLISGDEDHLPNPVLSLDAALALAERVLPGLDIDLEIRPTHEGLATDAIVYSHGYGPTPNASWRAWSPTPALALCIAILKALPTPTPSEQTPSTSETEERG